MVSEETKNWKHYAILSGWQATICCLTWMHEWLRTWFFRPDIFVQQKKLRTVVTNQLIFGCKNAQQECCKLSESYNKSKYVILLKHEQKSKYLMLFLTECLSLTCLVSTLWMMNYEIYQKGFHGCLLVDLWLRHGCVLVASWLRHGSFMVRLWLRHGYLMVALCLLHGWFIAALQILYAWIFIHRVIATLLFVSLLCNIMGFQFIDQQYKCRL